MGWPTLRVADWEATRDTLHMYTQIVGKLKMALSPPVNHLWHCALRVSARGLSTGSICVGERILDMEFDFVSHQLVVRVSDGSAETIALQHSSVAGFYTDVVGVLKRFGVQVSIHAVPNEVLVAIPFAEDTLHSTYEPDHAHAFWQQLVTAQRVLEDFRSRYRGKVSPVHFFWGAMDLAVTRFSGRPAPTHPGGVPNCPDHIMWEAYSDELSSAGFWPGGGTEGAFYSYAYPTPTEFPESPVPRGAHYDADLGEFLLPYERARAADHPDALVRDFFEHTFRAAADRANWPAPHS